MRRNGEAEWRAATTSTRCTPAHPRRNFPAQTRNGAIPRFYTTLECRIKDIDGAEDAYRAAIAADPSCSRARGNLGVLLATVRKDIDGAEDAYREAIAADSGNARMHTVLGLLLSAARGDVDGAEAAYRTAIALDPNHADAHYYLGLLPRAAVKHLAADCAMRINVNTRPCFLKGDQ